MRDLITHLRASVGLTRQASVTTVVRGETVDCRGANALAWFVFVGAAGANPLAANGNRYVLSVEEADADVNGNPVNWGPVPAAKIFGELQVTEPNRVYKVGTSATLHRFVRLVVTPVGTPTAEMNATAVQGHLGTEGKAW